jgi:hypothetical protein
MFDCSNTPVAVRAEDQPLIEAINDARRRYPFSDAAAEQLLNAFTNPEPRLKTWIFELCDPSPRADPFVTSDYLAAYTREVGTKGRDYSARWADLTTKERKLGRRIKRFARDKKRVWMGAGPPQNVDRALILYVIRLIEEATGVPFRFARPARLRGAVGTLGPARLGGPMLRFAEAALHRLFAGLDRLFRDDRVSGYLGLVSPARHYTRWEIARTAQLARGARMSPASPANRPSDLILAFRSEVRVELAGKVSQKNKDQGSASPTSWAIFREALKRLLANPWVDLREALEAAAASERQTPSGLDVLQANLKSGAEPNLIELAKRKIVGACLVSPMPEEPSVSPPPSTGKTS